MWQLTFQKQTCVGCGCSCTCWGVHTLSWVLVDVLCPECVCMPWGGGAAFLFNLKCLLSLAYVTSWARHFSYTCVGGFLLVLRGGRHAGLYLLYPDC